MTMQSHATAPPFERISTLIVGSLVLICGIGVAIAFWKIAYFHSFGFAGNAFASFMIAIGVQICLRARESESVAVNIDPAGRSLALAPGAKQDLQVSHLSAAVVSAEEWLDTSDSDSSGTAASLSSNAVAIAAPRLLTELPYKGETTVQASASEFLRIAARIEQKVLTAYCSRFPNRCIPGSPISAIEQLTDNKGYPSLLATAVKQFWDVRNSFVFFSYEENGSQNLSALVDLGLRLDFLLSLRAQK